MGMGLGDEGVEVFEPSEDGGIACERGREKRFQHCSEWDGECYTEGQCKE